MVRVNDGEVVGRSRKRLRVNYEGDDSEQSTDISRAESVDAESDSDSSLKVISEHGRMTDPHIGEGDDNDDNDDDDDYLLRALNETKDEDGNISSGSQDSSEIATEIENLGPLASKLEKGMEQSPVIEPIDLEAEIEEQQAVEEICEQSEPRTRAKFHTAVRDYKCPICLEPPENACIAPCGHIFCVSCLFQMVNNSRGQKKSGTCALCRKEIQFRQVKIVILKKKRVRKGV